MTATVTSKGQVTLPKAVRDLLDIKPGSVIDFQRAPDGRIVLVKVNELARSTRFAALRGHAGKGLVVERHFVAEILLGGFHERFGVFFFEAGNEEAEEPAEEAADSGEEGHGQSPFES